MGCRHPDYFPRLAKPVSRRLLCRCDLVRLTLAFGTAELRGGHLDRFRPDLFEPLTVLPVDASFPSAHAAQITAFALAAWFLLSRSKRILFAPLLLTLVVAVAFSRLYLQVHWPSDVIVGVALGLLCASAVQFTFFTRNPL
ncbi:MAG: hypothetical protein B7Z03_11630 [Hydrogenophilales bacterium 32-62-9]|nr:MAG: hypothetical protein B7Z03_11630 [Hydrogenophilales bacterium 32-62-9]